MALPPTVLLPTPEGPEITISLPLSFICHTAFYLFFRAARRDRLGRERGEDDISAVHGENRARAASEGGVDQQSPVAYILDHALDRS